MVTWFMWLKVNRCNSPHTMRIVNNRPYNLAKTREWLYSEQAGFRKLCSCEGQTLSITQTIINGFQVAKPQRSLMALLGLSKTIDPVLREDFLLPASSKGLPIPLAHWWRDSLSHCPASVHLQLSLLTYAAPAWQPLAVPQSSRNLADPPPCHCRTKEFYTKTYSWPVDFQVVPTRRVSSPVYRPVTPPSS